MERTNSTHRFLTDRKSALEQLLSRHFYVVKTGPENFDRALKEAKPHLVLARLADEGPPNDAAMKALHAMAAASPVPLAVFSSVVDAGFYLQCLHAGIVYHVKSPGSKQYLVSKLSALMKKNFIVDRPGETMHFSLTEGGRNHDLTLTREQLAAFLFSTMDNSLHQTKLVQDIMKKKCTVLRATRESEFLNASSALTVDEALIAEELERSFRNDDFRLFFQPVIGMASGAVTGFEALLRWEHPQRGLVAPDEFVPVLEKTPLIGPLGFWIVEEAARQVRRWHDEFSFKHPLRVNVNLSARQFILDELCDRIMAITEEFRVSPESLAFEITESAFMEDMDAANLMCSCSKRPTTAYIWMTSAPAIPH
jgi:hypothetical protein